MVADPGITGRRTHAHTLTGKVMPSQAGLVDPTGHLMTVVERHSVRFYNEKNAV
jgi:hypothetical protein